jgi:predicted AAA+ superfamily ATPase
MVDPSLAVAALHASAESLAADPKTLGLLFENLCLRDLSVYAEAASASVFHYRDNSDLEVDAIIAHPDGRWVGCEIKWGSVQEDRAAESLTRLRDKMLAAGQRPPAALVVIVGVGGFSHTRPDGVVVAPIDVLGP